MNKITSDVMVSICCITYNHEQYIAQALEGFVTQKTNFKVEILIGEDCSTDATCAVIQEYIDRYPGLIRLLTGTRNIGAIQNQIRVMSAATGKYIAMCDGDDFWIDPYKLQKQVDFLEHYPEYVMCCHYTKVIDDANQLVYVNDKPVGIEHDYQDVLLGQREETRVCSLMIKNISEVREIMHQDWYFDTYGSDTLFKLYALFKTGEKIYVMPEVMACYRHHPGGIWSMIDSRIRKRKMVDDFNITIKHFSYSGALKRKLRKFYLNNYFLFDMRYMNFRGAFATIRILL